jgi:hypothetical protein
MVPIILLNNYDKSQLKPNTILVVDINTKNIQQILKDGFKNPVISTKIYETIFKTPKICFYWDDKPSDLKMQIKMLEISMKNVLRNIKINKKNCNIFIKLSENTCNYLYNNTRFIKFNFGNISEQREISGEFILSNHKSNIFEIEINQNSIIKGDKESAEYVKSFGTFHTHPYDAYKKYNVCIAWPSADDYISFLYMYGLCYSGFHIVSTLEGIYLISLKKYIPPQKIIKNFNKIKDNVEYHHGVDYPETDNHCNIDEQKINMKKINKYVKRINKKGKFNLVFVKWENCTKPIKLKYSNIDNNCLLSTEQGNFLNIISN